MSGRPAGHSLLCALCVGTFVGLSALDAEAGHWFRRRRSQTVATTTVTPVQSNVVVARVRPPDTQVYPMLGTFYRSPKPGEAPFVEVGDKIDADTVVGIVEVMKLMSSITAGVTGEVTKVFAQNGQLVEADQPLFAVRTAA